jgi:hypothetical protein
MTPASVTGGCQCGAVRFRAARLGRATICHCRMCQKAFGGFFGPLVTAHGVEWTRGAPAYFASSDKVQRGFCAACGTPLSYEAGGPAEIAIGALDWLCALPLCKASDDPQHEALKASLTSFQHPDHDTAKWPMGAVR